MPGISPSGAGSIVALPPSAATGSKLAARTVMTFLASPFHRRQRVAGIDRPHERIGVDHRGDVADRLHVQQRRDPRHHVLADGGRGRQQMGVARRQRHQQRRERLGQHMIASAGASATSTLATPGSFAAAAAASP